MSPLRARAGHAASASVLVAVVALGCSHTGVMQRADDLELPASYDIQSGLQTSGVKGEVCSAVGDDQLAALQRRLASGSFDLRGAIARLEAAEARAREVGAPLLPRIDADLTVTRSSSASLGAGGFGGVPTQLADGGASTSYQPSLAASYEIDVWGKLRARKAAALLEVEASEEDFLSLAITLSSTVSEVWFGIVAELELLALLEQQAETSERFLELTELRFGQGLGAAQDIGRQREQLLSLRGQIELARGRLRSLEAQLQTLLGITDQVTPSAVNPLRDQLVQAGLPELGVPAELLQTRPRSGGRGATTGGRRSSACRRDQGVVPELDDLRLAVRPSALDQRSVRRPALAGRRPVLRVGVPGWGASSTRRPGTGRCRRGSGVLFAGPDRRGRRGSHGGRTRSQPGRSS